MISSPWRGGIGLALLVLLLGSVEARAQGAVVRLARWLTGTFSSQEQALADTAFLDIRLQVVPIWPSRTDGCWLTLEQASSSKHGLPYRQRVYRLRQLPDSTIVGEVFALPQAEACAGSGSRSERWDLLNADSLRACAGCALYLRPQGDSAFVGSTRGTGCASTLQGASYATSVVLVTDSVLISWDRGWDARGNQVWGAVSGGYVFRKLDASEIECAPAR
jgi:hypothetical protein